MSLKEQLAEYRAGWYQRVPADRQAVMQRHVDELRSGTIPHTILKAGDYAPRIVLENAKGATVDVGTLLKKGPVIVTFYRGGWCPYCNLELKAYQQILPEITAAGASLVAISPEKPRRHAVDRGEERAQLRGAQRCWPKGRTCIRLGLRVHRRAQERLPWFQFGYPGAQWDAGRMGAAGICDLRYRPQRFDYLRVHGCRLPRPRRSPRRLTRPD